MNVIPAPLRYAPPPAKENGDQWAVLAGLRCVLASIVVSQHLGFVAYSTDLTRTLQTFGASEAVLGFFLISGYSIAHSLSQHTDWRDYMRRRFWRIYPVYIGALVLGMVPIWLWGNPFTCATGSIGGATDFKSLILDLLLVQGVGFATIGLAGVAWSLSVEWILYILALGFRKMSTGFLAGIVAASALLFDIAPHFKPISQWAYWGLKDGLPLLMLCWLWIAGFLYYRHKDSPAALPIFIGSVLAAIVLCDNSGLTRHGILTVAGTAALIGVARFVRLPKFSIKPLNYLGDLSYPLYLVHIPVMLCLYPQCYETLPWVFPTSIALVTLLFYHAIDKPLRRFGQSRRTKAN